MNSLRHGGRNYARGNFISIFISFTSASYCNIVRVIKSGRLIWAIHLAGMEEGRSVFKILTSEITGNGPLGRRRPRGEDLVAC